MRSHFPLHYHHCHRTRQTISLSWFSKLIILFSPKSPSSQWLTSIELLFLSDYYMIVYNSEDNSSPATFLQFGPEISPFIVSIFLYSIYRVVFIYSNYPARIVYCSLMYYLMECWLYWKTYSTIRLILILRFLNSWLRALDILVLNISIL